MRKIEVIQYKFQVQAPRFSPFALENYGLSNAVECLSGSCNGIEKCGRVIPWLRLIMAF